MADGHASEWRQVMDSRIGFHQTSSTGHQGSTFSKTSLLEKERARLVAAQTEVAGKLKAKAAATAVGSAPALSDRALFMAAMYTTEASRSMVHHAPLKFSAEALCRPMHPLPRGKNHGPNTDWIDVALSKGCLMPIVASSRLGVTRML
jgi:hypothetical protein